MKIMILNVDCIKDNHDEIHADDNQAEANEVILVMMIMMFVFMMYTIVMTNMIELMMHMIVRTARLSKMMLMVMNDNHIYDVDDRHHEDADVDHLGISDNVLSRLRRCC